MRRFFGILLVCVLLLAAGSNLAFAYDGPHKYGIELRGGFGMYDMGDVPMTVTSMENARAGNTSTTADAGPMGGLSLIFRPLKNGIWEVGYNAILDVENTVESTIADTNGSILMHANEFFMKAHLAPWIGDRINLQLGVGLSYYNVELQIQNDFTRQYTYDAVGRCWGLTGSAGLEFLISDGLGINFQGGGRIANATHFSYEATQGVRTGLNVPGGSRPMEVNMSGLYGSAGLRFYFDKVFPPVDFSR
jgi:hypothetical protein